MQQSQPSPTWQQPPPPYNQDAPSPNRSGGPNIVLIVVLSVIGTLVVIGIIAWLFAVFVLMKAVDDVTDDTNEVRKATTLDTIATIDQAVTIYKVSVDRFPRSLQALTKPWLDDGDPLLRENMLDDAWGNPFEYKVNGRNFTIRSAGPDGKMNTEDDITN